MVGRDAVESSRPALLYAEAGERWGALRYDGDLERVSRSRLPPAAGAGLS
jgi:hypothetical protein